jgi:DNA-binding transcriptional MerR regulator
MQRTATDEGLRIGELAERVGLTVRTLHHYDRIGLMRASGRTEAGHRRYAEADVRRLYQVVALRSLGVPLAGIARALEGDGYTLRDAVAAQLGAVEDELRHARRLRRRLEGILDVLERSDDPSVDELIEVMEVVTMHETYYTPEQLERLERRREEVGTDEIARVEREWAELSAAMKAKRDAGVDPSDPEVRELARRWTDLTERTIAGFTGGDPGLTASLGRMYKEEGPEKASRGTFDADLLEYVTRAQQASDGPSP